jgi:hypothetical protein
MAIAVALAGASAALAAEPNDDALVTAAPTPAATPKRELVSAPTDPKTEPALPRVATEPVKLERPPLRPRRVRRDDDGPRVRECGGTTMVRACERLPQAKGGRATHPGRFGIATAVEASASFSASATDERVLREGYCIPGSRDPAKRLRKLVGWARRGRPGPLRCPFLKPPCWGSLLCLLAATLTIF